MAQLRHPGGLPVMTVETFQVPASALAAASPAGNAIESIMRWHGNLLTAGQAIRMIVDTPFMPTSFWPAPRVNGTMIGLKEWPNPQFQHPRESPEDYAARRDICIASGAIAVVKGDEIGLTPQVALESIYVVHGKPGMYAETMEALARQHHHHIVLVELTDRLCRMRGKHRDSDVWQNFEFTMERARKAGYVKRNSKYDEDPQTMLHSRCRALTVRGTCPEVLKGLRSVEEITDDGDGEARPATRTVQRAPAARALAAPSGAPVVSTGANADAPTLRQTPAAPPARSAPPLPGERETPAASEVPMDGAIQEGQWRSINARLLELGVKGEGQKAARASIIRLILDAPELNIPAMTAAQAAFVLDQLAGDSGARVVDSALRPEQGTAPSQAGPPLPGDEQAHVGSLDEHGQETYDPTVEDDWPGTLDTAAEAIRTIGDDQ